MDHWVSKGSAPKTNQKREGAGRKYNRKKHNGHIHGIRSLSFSSDGQLLASIDTSGKLILLDTGDLLPIAMPLECNYYCTGSFSPDGEDLALAGRGALNFRNLSAPSLAEVACTVANRNLSLQEWETYVAGQPYRKTCFDRIPFRIPPLSPRLSCGRGLLARPRHSPPVRQARAVQ